MGYSPVVKGIQTHLKCRNPTLTIMEHSWNMAELIIIKKKSYSNWVRVDSESILS